MARSRGDSRGGDNLEPRFYVQQPAQPAFVQPVTTAPVQSTPRRATPVVGRVDQGASPSRSGNAVASPIAKAKAKPQDTYSGFSDSRSSGGAHGGSVDNPDNWLQGRAGPAFIIAAPVEPTAAPTPAKPLPDVPVAPTPLPPTKPGAEPGTPGTPSTPSTPDAGRPRQQGSTLTLDPTPTKPRRDVAKPPVDKRQVCHPRPKDNRPKGGGGGSKRWAGNWCS